MTKSKTQNNSTLKWLKSHRVAVLKGGWSRERPISLKSGQAVERAFRRLGVRAISIDVKTNIMDVLKKKRVQFAFISLHGAFGEDGGVQAVLDVMKIPYNGSGPLASALAMDKNLSKVLFAKAGVPIPEGISVSKNDSLADATRLAARGPVFVKPFDQGSAIGASRVDKPAQLKKALAACFRVSSAALVEKFVPGREFTVGVLDGKALPVVEIIPKHAFYDFHSKYAAGGSRHVTPAPISAALTKRAQTLSLRAFKALGCSGYGRVDLLMKKTGQMVVLEVNTIPGMTDTSLLPDAARAIGISFDELVLKICAAALRSGR